MLRTAAAHHEKEGHTIFTESQNTFVLKGRTGTLSGKPDVVAVKDMAGWVIDTKTGSPKASDRVQVMIYMWALPKVIPAFAGVRFDGKVIYKTGYNLIMADEVDGIFIKRVGDLMKEICGEAEPHKAPSVGECQHCPITVEDCAERAGAVKVHQGETDDF